MICLCYATKQQKQNKENLPELAAPCRRCLSECAHFSIQSLERERTIILSTHWQSYAASENNYVSRCQWAARARLNAHKYFALEISYAIQIFVWNSVKHQTALTLEMSETNEENCLSSPKRETIIAATLSNMCARRTCCATSANKLSAR